MKRLTLALLLSTVGFLFLAGCSNFSNNVFRAEQTSVALVHAAYSGYTNYLAAYPTKITAEQSNTVKQARLRFAASVSTTENLRAAYATNTAIRPQLEGMLMTVMDQSSNVVWLIHYVQGK